MRSHKFPRVSFVIPSHNCAAYLAHAIESCQKQSYPNVEVVVFDDGSTDTTELLMRHFEDDRRIVYHRSARNVGRSEARNIGNDLTSGEFICVLDADDIAYNNRAKLTAAGLAQADIVHGSCEYIDILGNKLGTHIADVFNKDLAIKDGVNRIVHSTLAYTKDMSKRFPYRSGRLSDLGLDDWAFEIEAAVWGAKFGLIQATIGAYREHPNGISKTRKAEDVRSAKSDFMSKILSVGKVAA